MVSLPKVGRSPSNGTIGIKVDGLPGDGLTKVPVGESGADDGVLGLASCVGVGESELKTT